MKLVIVESPAKCDTIQKYLGNNYIVKASKGHIRDLANSGKGGLGVDIDNDFAPNYIIKKDKYALISELKKDVKECEEVILATDPDREGEAIAWHLAVVLGLDIKKTKRLEFHEITRESIKEAMENPRTIDMSIFSSQESRRILDRIIGYKLSNLINRKIKAKSAGRVQSATLRLIAEHQKEIDSFVPEEYWNVNCKILFNGEEISLSVVDEKGKSIEIKNELEALEILSRIPEDLPIVSIEKSFRTKESKEPFKTSTLQQEAFSKLKFKTSKTQSLAQNLYEGIEVGGEHVGLITYIRTDSSTLSSTFVNRAKTYIENTFGSEYLGNIKKGKIQTNAQLAHEAIRHTSNHRTPESIKSYLKPDQYKLYKLIYNRTLASLMKPKKEEVLTIILGGDKIFLKFELTRTVFKGFEIVENKKEAIVEWPDLHVGDTLKLKEKTCEQKFTQGPSHYSEAKVVNIMEELGIGRPSTYVPTLQNLIKSKYIVDEDGVLKITPHGAKTSHVLVKYFPDIINVKYTAKIEEQLDQVLEGKMTRSNLLTNTYLDFRKSFDNATMVMYNEPPEEAEGVCPLCGAKLIYRESRHGKFIGCSNWPSCKYIKKEEKERPEEVGRNCPTCGKPLVKRKNAKNKEFIACSNYPKCTYIEADQKEKVEELTDKVCPECGNFLVIKKGKYGKFYGCSNYPTCKYIEKIKKYKSKK